MICCEVTVCASHTARFAARGRRGMDFISPGRDLDRDLGGRQPSPTASIAGRAALPEKSSSTTRT